MFASESRRGARTRFVAPFALWAAFFASSGVCAEKSKVDFRRQILPLLSNNCFECHGPDKKARKAKLRLDEKDSVFAELRSGETGIVAGKSTESEIFARIATDDEDDLMPPPDSGKKLTKKEIELIRRWIDEGADWSGHWAFETPKKPEVPKAQKSWRVANSVDAFIQSRLAENGLALEDPADKETLIRRVTLDLTGLPPTIAEIDAFLADKSDKAYERLVDRRLASEKYAEHMTRYWLDLARYADTHGLHLDNERSIWPYREWLIDSFHRNQRFDEFTVEQLAGDLLPKPTLEQRVATGFNRCNVTTSEGGSIDAEYYVRYAADRVETTSTVWLGLTAGCAACHDHKFDPLTQKEFYQLFAYFYSLTERAMDGNALLPPPSVKVPSRQQREDHTRWQKELDEATKKVSTALAKIEYKDPTPNAKLDKLERADTVWIDDTLPPGAKPAGNEGDKSWKFGGEKEKHPVFSGKTSSKRTAKGLSQHYFEGATNPLVITGNETLFAYVWLDPKNPPKTVQLQFNDGSWEHRAYWGEDKGHAPGRNNGSNRRLGDLPKPGEWARLEVAASAVDLKPGAKVGGWAFTQFDGTVYWDKAGVVSLQALPEKDRESLALWEQYRAQQKSPALPGEIQKILDVVRDKRSKEQTAQLTKYFVRNVNPKTKALLGAPLKTKTDLESKLANLQKSMPSTLVMEDRKTPRQAYVLERGEYTLQRDKVSPKIPEWISPSLKDMPSNRLGLAQWLIARENPLTSRVTVNRFWQQLFGTGIVRTSEDFGIQGEQPTHPELLDWLAVEFIDQGWNVKGFLKMLLMSETYRQSSRVTREKLAVDPENRLLARGARFRLDAEVIRDQALYTSGLLVPTVGGKSVKPYQPAGLWKPVGFGGSNTSVFKQDKGDKLYRRSMYTFWKRTSPPPSLQAFDAPNRETCQVRRTRTNTPMQALVLMNDVQFVEAARRLAERIVTEGGRTVDERLTWAFRSIVTRRPHEREAARLKGLLELCLDDFRKDPEAAEKLLSAGESPRNTALDVPELGAWTIVAHLILNLSETVTKS